MLQFRQILPDVRLLQFENGSKIDPSDPDPKPSCALLFFLRCVIAHAQNCLALVMACGFLALPVKN